MNMKLNRWKNENYKLDLIPNPEAAFEAENFLGGKELSGLKGSEFTLSASQLFELGGKRSSRINLAESEITSAKGEL